MKIEDLIKKLMERNTVDLVPVTRHQNWQRHERWMRDLNLLLQEADCQLKLTRRIRLSRKNDKMESTGFLKGGSLE